MYRLILLLVRKHKYVSSLTFQYTVQVIYGCENFLLAHFICDMLCFCSHGGEATSEVAPSIVMNRCVTSNRDMEGYWHEVDHAIAELFWQLGTIEGISEMSKGIDSFSATAFGFLKWIFVFPASIPVAGNCS